jgi:hypothetical protein
MCVMNRCHVFLTVTRRRYVRRDESTPMTRNGSSVVTPDVVNMASMSGSGVASRALGGQWGSAFKGGAAGVFACVGGTVFRGQDCDRLWRTCTTDNRCAYVVQAPGKVNVCTGLG